MDNKDIQTQSFLALLHSFKIRKWMFKKIDSKNFVIVAEACRRNYCLSVVTRVDKKGKVHLSRISDNKISRRGANVLKRWVNLLKQAYYNIRCDSIKSLREKTKSPVCQRGRTELNT